MKQATLILAIISIFYSCEKKPEEIARDFPTTFEISNGTKTATYAEVLEFYMALAKEFPEINIQTIGETDSGEPLHVVTYNEGGTFNFNKIGEENTVILINNGIHPGESDGIDATMMLFRDLASGKISPLERTVVASILVYNVGGALNRNSHSRANQNGPKSYGFRGNARNFDLNRDFIKGDTKNARTFAQIFHMVKPDVFIDNHVSNGADYQYILTHLFTQHNKLGDELGAYLNDSLMPALQDSLALSGWDITPYVNVFNKPPEIGFQQFMDHPRYSTGYTTLWNTLGMMVETHMLKPYKQRVDGTYMLMKKMIAIAEIDGERIKRLRDEAGRRHLEWEYYPVQWQVDTTQYSVLNFKGFKADTIPSEVTGFPRLKFNRDAPFTKNVTYQNYFMPSDSVKIPEAYIIPKQWNKVIELLDLNHIEYTAVENDTLLNVGSYRIQDYETVENPYEGHYLHFNTKVSSTMREVQLKKDDIWVPTNQTGFRYILETLEPTAPDSFFNWNFFDTILQQKEGFSPYVFEDSALKMLQNDSILNREFQLKKEQELSFSENWYAQLEWLFEKSKYYEKAHMQYPVYRFMKN
ncbi:hypothetical protein EJ994_01395 [Maribacter sp. MJ134]|uniref:M14 family metallopeptidase n=1 Tax=Maribacter sp. MJ134 TaxID=2496865 RepID=UPI000F817519|nr:M14 family metallopeptidase [Maribacter sp. MJ134]AZQ57527.1 hypothetical protein EJ994_01395 [Maribacter sp. MJ134]